MRTAFALSLFPLLASCGMVTVTDVDGSTDGHAGGDLTATVDLSGVPSLLCTTPACAATPCTTGCAFTTPAIGGCPRGMSTVSTTTARACPGFCGFIQNYGGLDGCRRFKSEDHCCTSDCHCNGSWACFPTQSDIDYHTGGDICPNGYSCYPGLAPGDMSPGVCLDSGLWGFPG